MPPAPAPTLLQHLWRRIKVCFFLKAFGIPGFMAAFFAGYFWLLNHPFENVTVMGLTAVDDALPYHPLAWVPYVSLWIYVQIPPTLADTRRELLLYGWASAVVSLVGFGIFMLWPTKVPALALQLGDSSVLSHIKSLDTTGNSCPSLHVAFSVFSAVWIARHLAQARASSYWQAANLLWCVAIMYSTLGTKQHVFWDVVAGALLGFAGAAYQARLEAGARRRQVTACSPVTSTPAQAEKA